MVDVSKMDFQALAEAAKKISDRRVWLQAQEQSLSKQVSDLEGALVKEYGENYMDVFNDAVVKISKWESDHESV
jgi:hypothetical protein